MIRYLTVFPGPMRGFLQHAPAEMRIVPYHRLSRLPTLAPGPYIFADVDQMDARERGLAIAAWTALNSAGSGPLVNDPAAVVQRHDLLELLHVQGANDFRSFRADRVPDALRYPVFVRHERVHGGSWTPLLHTRAAVDHWLAVLGPRAALLGLDPAELLVVEHLDTADASGVHRKYSAFRVGDRVLPRHVLFSREWQVNKPDLTDPELLREELAYCDDNPHEAWLDDVFGLAQVGYGRIDYSVVRGRPQVWEINLNPVVLPARVRPDDPRAGLHRRFARDLVLAFGELGARPPAIERPPVPFDGAAAAQFTPAAGRVLRPLMRHQWPRRLALGLFDALPAPVVAAVAHPHGRRVETA